ncbi:uncharacterized protein LOC125236983 [Leguminivora glycinivorella]|uniref:uncharacterized protein LOC125236983 n=1 Tax=Leguminivora glycinivorella TaxID=1035111 RepID=UPI00200FD86C|nr:uncharacterized protein LOC125236983 [Leguminivora glycinivorella]
MKVLLLFCLFVGVYAHYEVQRTGRTMKSTRNHTLKTHPKKKLFLGSTFMGTMKVLAHVATVLSVVEVTASLMDRFGDKSKQEEDSAKAEEVNDEEVEMVDENTDEEY